MAKYEVTHKCGHEITHELFGKIDDRYSKIDWLETKDCKDCWRATQVAAEQAQVATVDTDDYPQLTGSDKQIDWATRIRAKMIVEWDELAGMPIKELPDNMREPIMAVLAEESAAWWIDHRTLSLREMATDVVRAAQKESAT